MNKVQMIDGKNNVIGMVNLDLRDPDFIIIDGVKYTRKEWRTVTGTDGSSWLESICGQRVCICAAEPDLGFDMEDVR